MKCVVPGANVKILARAIHALAKIGDEMYVEPQKDALSFRTVNLANSAYADFTFYESYFSYYIYGDLQQDDASKCKISMRSAMAVFKAPNLLDKQIETCHIKLEPDASEIVFILKYKNSITKTHLLPILDCEVLQTAYNKESAVNQVLTQPKVLGDVVQIFHQNLIEITLEVLPQKLLLRNYVDDSSGLSNTTRTQLALGMGEFDRYVIGSETSITFCMKEFKAILNFAEMIGIPMSLYFEAAGRPVIFSLKNPTFEANLVLSTLSSDADSQTETILFGKQEKSVKRRASNKRTSRKSSKTTNRTGNRSGRASKTLEEALLKKTLPSLVEDKQQKSGTSTKQTNKSLSTSSKDVVRNEVESDNEVPCASRNKSHHEKSTSISSTNNETSRFDNSSINKKKLANSVFSTITKRKSVTPTDDRQQNQNMEEVEFEDAVPSSPPPPAKKARLIFQKCFQRTFDPRTLPGYDVILAEDSDEHCSE